MILSTVNCAIVGNIEWNRTNFHVHAKPHEDWETAEELHRVAVRTFIEDVQSQTNSAVTVFTEDVQFFEITSTTKTAGRQCRRPVKTTYHGYHCYNVIFTAYFYQILNDI